MFESKAQCIANCLRSTKSTHALYRTFGLNEIDAPNAPMRKDILVQLSTFYPDVTFKDAIITRVESNGQFYYDVKIHG